MLEKSLHIGTYWGIPVKIHWSFSFVFLLIGYISYADSLRVEETLACTALVLCAFFCVVLHEYGHALMARRFDIDTQDIILMPIGGVARLYTIPSDPTKELLVAIAGPLVNLVIAILILVFLYLKGVGIIMTDEDALDILTNWVGFLHMLLIVNVISFGFNLLPAFPMDGGRILRALLSYKYDRLKSTYIASIIGKSMAVTFLIFGAYNQMPTLAFIGIFIFMEAGREYNMLRATKI